ncbi:MAG: class I SAM-dependent methyltransferase [Dehalococcoidales bacterium]
MTEVNAATSFIPEVYNSVVRQIMPFYDTVHSETVDLVKTIKPDVKQWLDTGCGTGNLVELALKAFPDTGFILADPTEKMIQAAAVRLKVSYGQRVTFLPPTSTEGLPAHKDVLKTQVITAILCHHYYHPEQRRTATGVCYQLLDPGGVYITVENIMPDSVHGTHLAIERWKRFQVEHGRTAIMAEKHAARLNSEYFPITVQEHLTLLKETGFKTVELFWKSHMQAGFYAIK